ncbi:helix-turn-helix transcriptional regulator [Micromonospora humi]|uniref:Helix-turn-helix domain-containing protein n=1 Tax=Micromonospora humi TaxID=745366 RepID=A0A1C5K4W7_9ACTN|nr:helix-turn-helix transcriptional regulator [Micromonospora humi]SCG77436.1 Helix-turn-helix domain-containing protein [Micromonospora humi]
MTKAGRLGEYLRARRELIGPADVGLPGHGRRRVPGLRREEVALLAGISADYYLRLEQGRDRHPSDQVLDALARALLLDADATAHLHRLGRPVPMRPARRPEQVSTGIRQLVASWSETPAFVYGRYADVLFANRAATALSPIFTAGTNVLRAVFLDPAAPAAYPLNETVVSNAVAGLRSLVAADPDDPRLTDLVDELSSGSDRFRRLWARYDVAVRSGGGLRTFHHPRAGELRLRYEKLAVTGTSQMLVVYHAEPGSGSAAALRALARVDDTNA